MTGASIPPRSQATRVVVLAASFVLAGALASPAMAWDTKTMNPGAACTAYAPDTTADELQFSPTGIYNPGATNEKVMCSLPHDSENVYGSVNQLDVKAWYRVIGGTPARMTCTLFIGTTSQFDNPVGTMTAAGDLKSAGGRTYVGLGAATQSQGSASIPLTILCSIPPKTSFGAIVMSEQRSTEG